MSNILDKIISNKKKEVEKQKGIISLFEINKLIEKKDISFKKGIFTQSIKNSDSGIIAEFKKRSPSKDWIFKDAKIEEIIPSYSSNEASAISVLTDYDFFGGTLEDLKQASEITQTPLLRKDFMVDEYQVYEALLYGANAILLIAGALTVDKTLELAILAKKLGLDVLLEVHNEGELANVNEYVDIIGVNNRNLTTFITEVKISFDLVDKIPNDFVKISESGISSVEIVKELKAVGYQGFLMGENFMKTSHPGESLGLFIEELKK